FTCPIKSFGDYLWNFINGANQAAPFGKRKRQAENIRFLERVGPYQCTTNLASDAHQRNRIHLRISNSGDKIGCARPAGCNRDANLYGRSRMAFSGEDRALLVPSKNVANAATLKRVIQRHDRAAGIAEDQINAFGAQTFQKYFSALKH